MRHNQNPTDRPRRRRLRWLAVIAVVAAAAVAPNTTAADAQTVTQAPADVAVASYAADYSVSHSEAQRRLDRIQPLQAILASIRDIETLRLAGWGIDHAGTFTGWVWLTGNQPPSATASRIADANTDIEIRTGATHGLAELFAAQAGLFQDIGPVGQATDGSGPAGTIESIVTYTSINMRDNALEIGIDPSLAPTVPGGLEDPGPIGVTDETLQAKITEVTRQLQDHIVVNYVVEDGRGIAAEATFAGGERIGGCTSGFAARKNGGGTYGIVTAGHCGDDGPHDNSPLTMHNVSLPLDYGWASVNADAQFHTIPTGSGHVLKDDYLCHASWPINYCDVTDTETRSQMIDDYVCHAGRNSGVSCGTVVDTTYQPRHTGACRSSRDDVTSCNHVFVKVEGPSLRSCGGDSGGPWYRNGVAYGIHLGSNSKNNCSASNIFAIFSAIVEVTEFLGVEVLTEGNVTIP